MPPREAPKRKTRPTHKAALRLAEDSIMVLLREADQHFVFAHRGRLGVEETLRSGDGGLGRTSRRLLVEPGAGKNEQCGGSPGEAGCKARHGDPCGDGARFLLASADSGHDARREPGRRGDGDSGRPQGATKSEPGIKGNTALAAGLKMSLVAGRKSGGQLLRGLRGGKSIVAGVEPRLPAATRIVLLVEIPHSDLPTSTTSPSASSSPSCGPLRCRPE